jgi:hypothetical protein
MTIISVNYTSPWYRLTDYAIPANLPECPEGGCICTWNWVHLAGNGEGDGEEIVRPSPKRQREGADNSIMSCIDVRSLEGRKVILSTHQKHLSFVRIIRQLVW